MLAQPRRACEVSSAARVARMRLPCRTGLLPPVVHRPDPQHCLQNTAGGIAESEQEPASPPSSQEPSPSSVGDDDTCDSYRCRCSHFMDAAVWASVPSEEHCGGELAAAAARVADERASTSPPANATTLPAGKRNSGNWMLLLRASPRSQDHLLQSTTAPPARAPGTRALRGPRQPGLCT